MGGGSGGSYSNATSTQLNDTMKTWAIPSIVPIAALWLWHGLRLHEHFLWIWKHGLVKTRTGFNLPDSWTAEPKENQPSEDSWLGAIHFLLKMIPYPEREDEVPARESSAQIQICGWTQEKLTSNWALFYNSSAISKNEQDVKSPGVKKWDPPKTGPQRRGLDHTARNTFLQFHSDSWNFIN